MNAVVFAGEFVDVYLFALPTINSCAVPGEAVVNVMRKGHRKP
jgi:hypothetical protein